MTNTPRPASDRRSGRMVLSLIGALIGACHREEPKPPPAPAAQPGVKVDAAPSSLLPSSTKDLRERLDARLRLGPDRRLLRALSDVDAIATDGPWKETTARWVGDRFLLERDGQELGRLSEFADFSESYALLTRAAQQHLGRGTLELEDDVDETSPTRPLALEDRPFLLQGEAEATLERVERRWAEGLRSRADLQAAALAMASLSFQALDTMELADRLAARALAVVALARAAGGSRPMRAEPLIAWALGYEVAAERLAEALPDGDPLRAFLEQDPQTLWRATRARAASPAARSLWARQRAEAGDAPTRRWLEDESFEVPELANRLRAGDPGANVEVAIAVAVLAQAQLTAEEPSVQAARRRVLEARGGRARWLEYRRLGSTLAGDPGHFPRLEKALAELPNGPLFDRGARQDYALAFLYSALDTLGRKLLDARALPELGAGLATELGVGSTPRAAELKHWLETLAQARAGRDASTELVEHLEAMTTLGQGARARIFDELVLAADWRDPESLALAQRLAAGLDARPKNRLRIGDLAVDGLRDLRVGERLYRAGLDSARSPTREVWMAGFTGDWGKLHRVTQGRLLSPSLRATAVLTLLRHRQLSREDAGQRLRGLLRARGNDWAQRQELVSLLEADARYAEARGLLGEWLERKLPEAGHERVLAQTALARQYWLEGDFPEAWVTVAPAVDSAQFDAVRLAALIRAAEGKPAEAEALARGLTKRLPGPRSDTVLAEVLWRVGGHVDAASVLSRPARAIGLVDWQGIGDAFSDAFGGRPDAEALLAVDALLGTSIDPFSLSQLAHAVASHGRPQLAFEILSRLRYPGPAQLELSVAAYQQRRKASDEATARAWLEHAVTPELREALAKTALRTKAYELAWTLVPSPTGHSLDADLVWLSRAVATLASDALPAASQTALKQRLQNTEGTHYHRLARYLLGLEDESAVLGLAGRDPRRACEIAYYVGRKAELDQRLDDASDWYRAAVETGATAQGEHRLALEQLAAWHRAGKTLARLAAEPRASAEELD